MRSLLLAWIFVLALGLAAPAAATQSRSTDAYLDQTRGEWEALARTIWETPELAGAEKKSSSALAKVLEREGFKVTWGIGNQPTGFLAVAGSGSPAIAFLAEYDALPALSQAAGSLRRRELVPGGPGHGCGHNLLGTASVAAAVAANRDRVARKLRGTIQVFGTPAEELLYGKTFMVRDGAFSQTDAALAWHPSNQTRVTNRTRLAASAVEVEFFGRAAHAAAAPWLGRSALDALALFDHAMALMREHVKPTARIHRIVKDGGVAANVIPDHTKGEYWLRDVTGENVQEMLEWLRKAAEGAALATQTKAEVKLLFSVRDPVPNDALNDIVQRELERVGSPGFDAADAEFAKALQQELGVEQSGLETKVSPLAPNTGTTASSDLAEVSAVVPLAELEVSTRPLGTSAHHWAQTASSAHSVGYRGMVVAAKVLAASGVDLLQDPKLVGAAKEELKAHSNGKPYVSPLAADARPPVPDAPAQRSPAAH